MVGAAGWAGATERPLATVRSEALARAEHQYDGLLARLPDDGRLPRSFVDGKLVTVAPDDWTSGFFPGSLWLLYEATGETKWLAAARRYTALLASEQNDRSTHDVGFMLGCSYGNGWRLTGDPAYRVVLRHGAEALASRFNPKVGCILSWNPRPPWKFPVIIDNLMNLELLLWAATNGEPELRDVAIAHADTTLRNHFRADGSSFHVVDYDPSTGAVRRRQTAQGASDGSAWARGQAWALYGYTMMYRETGHAAYLAQARHTAQFIMQHPRMPADRVPYWDFDAPGIPNAPRDSAAAAVICSALLELAHTVGGADGERYFRFAEAQLRSLASDRYLARDGTNGGFLLLHATGNYPAHSEIDVPLVYGDYYFLEALLRARRGPVPADASAGRP